MPELMDTVSDLATLWQQQPLTVAIGFGEVRQVLGADPRRWTVFFQVSAAIIGNPPLKPGSVDSPIKFNLSPGTPLRFSQKDDGPLPSGEWFFDNTGGGAITLFILSLQWLG